MTSKTLSDVAQRLTVSPSSHKKIRAFALVLVMFASIPAMSLAVGSGTVNADTGSTIQEEGDSVDVVYHGANGGVIRAVDTETGDSIWSQTQPTNILSVEVSQDGESLYSGSNGGLVKGWNATSGAEEWNFTVEGTSPVRGVTVGPSGDVVYAASAGSEMYALDADTGTEIWESTVFDGTVNTEPSVSPDGELVYAGSFDNTIRALDTDTGDEAWRYNITSEDSAASVEASFDGESVYAGAFDNTVRSLDAETGDEEWEYSAAGAPRSLAEPTGEGFVMAGLGNGDVVAVDTDTGGMMWDFGSHSEPVLGIGTNPGENEFYSGSEDGSLRAASTDTQAQNWVYNEGTNINSVSTIDIYAESPDLTTGTVIDENNDPLDNVTVEFRQDGSVVDSSVTGDNGRFGVAVENGTYDIVFSKPQYQTLSVTRTITEGQDLGTFELGPREFELDVPSRIDPEETATYIVTFDGDDVTSNATVTSGNETLLTVNNETQTINATEEIGVVNVTATYNASDGETYNVTEEVVVAPVDIEYLEILPGTWRFTAFLDSIAVQVILVSMCAAIIGTRASSAFGGLGAAQLTLTVGWFAGWVSTGVMLVGLFTAMFIGLNLAANIDYTIRR